MKGELLWSTLALPANITQGWKYLPGTNTLGYFAPSSATKKKV
jgi:hypothetical protein